MIRLLIQDDDVRVAREVPASVPEGKHTAEPRPRAEGTSQDPREGHITVASRLCVAGREHDGAPDTVPCPFIDAMAHRLGAESTGSQIIG